MVQKWIDQADAGHKLAMTIPEATRFWITMDQATAFTVKVLGLMRGGEIFIPEMGSSTLASLAHAVAPTADHERIPMRAGEKLHEVVVSRDEAVRTVTIPQGGYYYVIEPADPKWDYTGPGRVVYHKTCDITPQDASSFNARRLSAEDLAGMLETVP